MAGAAGVRYQTNDPEAGVRGCFACHATGPVSFDSVG
ncbi:MAG: hypothetical protein QOJ99_6172, partial [Bryobacterales bacterium]|nr:hypothetical protein [Bryobacterales bacterium]